MPISIEDKVLKSDLEGFSRELFDHFNHGITDNDFGKDIFEGQISTAMNMKTAEEKYQNGINDRLT